MGRKATGPNLVVGQLGYQANKSTVVFNPFSVIGEGFLFYGWRGTDFNESITTKVIKMKKIKISIATIAVLSFTLIYQQAPVGALSQSLNWQYAGWSGGGAFPAIVPDPNVAGRTFLISDVAGMWRSEDSGNQWTFKTQGLVNLMTASLAIAPSNSSIVYAGSDAGIHKSTDGGNSWTFLAAPYNLAVYRPDNYRSIAIDRLNPNKFFVATKAGEVFTSADGGASWSRVGSATYPFGQAGAISAVYLTRDNATLFVGSSLGLRKCDLGTGTWSSVNSGGYAVSDIVGYGFTETIYITYGNRVAWTVDNGATWQFSSNIPITNGIAYRLGVASDAAGNIKILVGWRDGWLGGAVLSNDGGRNWTNIERNLSHDVGNDPTRVWNQGFGWPLSVAIDPINPTTLYLTDFWGVWRSDDNGQSWQEKIKGAANTVGSDVTVMSDGSLLVGTMDNGLLKSTDGGKTYKTLVNGQNIDGHVWKVIATGNKIIATNSPWNVNRNQVLISTDGGATFTVTSSGLPQTRPTLNTVWWQSFPRALAVDPKNPNKVYLGMDGDSGGGFFYSDDGGFNWIRSTGQPSSLRVYNGLAVDPIETNRLYWGAVGSAGGVYRSEDYGKTWARVFSGSTWVFDVAVGSDGKVYAAGDSGGPSLYVSSDKGSTWTLLKKFTGNSGSCEAITIDPNNPKRIAVGSVYWSGWAPNKIYFTEDGGSTWTDITADLPAGDGAAAMAFSNDGNSLFMSRIAGTVYRVQLTTLDTTAPSAPANLQAVQSGTQVNLSWNISIDNIAVTGYEVSRNNVPLATVTTVTYADTTAIPGTTYSYTVKALDAANNFSTPSNTATLTVGVVSQDTLAPTAPLNLTASLSGTQVTLSWTASTDDVGVAGYQVLNNGSAIGASTTENFIHNALADTIYNYAVKAFDAAGNYSVSGNLVTVTVPPAAPPAPLAPANFTGSQVNGQVQLSWSASTGAVGYNIYRDGTLLKSVTTTSSFDNAVTAGTTYSYKVEAYDALNTKSLFSGQVTVTIPAPVADTQAPSTPTNLSSSVSGATINLSWSPSTDNVAVTLYKIFDDFTVQMGTSTTNSYTMTSAVTNTDYNLTVQACDAAGNCSSATNQIRVYVPGLVVDSTPPSAPTNLIASTSASQVNLSWNASTDNVGVAGYQIFKDTTAVGTTTATSYVVNNLTAGVSYSFTVKAFDAANNYSASSNMTVMTIPVPSLLPPINVAAIFSNGLVIVSWNPSPSAGVLGYNIYRNGKYIATYAKGNYYDGNVVAGNTYSYTLESYNYVNNRSAMSSPVAVTLPAVLPWVSSITSTTAIINWTTNKLSTGYVQYGFDAWTQPMKSYTTSSGTKGAVILSGLLSKRWYHYKVVLQSQGSTTISTDREFQTS